MLKSMTGYGKGIAERDNLTMTVEIKSVNHRYCDVSVKAPRNLLVFEHELKKKVGERLKRGKIDVFINQEFGASASMVPVLNEPLAEAYADLFRAMAQRFDLSSDIPLAMVANQKEVITVQEQQIDDQALRDCVGEALDNALQALEKMRQAEGDATQRDMASRLDLVAGLVDEVAQRAPSVVTEWRAKLQERLDRQAPDIACDPQRLAQEVVIFADRCDISEELTRFRSHLEQFRALFELTEPVGRQMDFLVQELNRETNTMGSKSNDALLTRTVVAIKSELEKIREQVQNIE